MRTGSGSTPPEQLAAVQYTPTGWCRPSCRGRTGEVLMMAWMNADTLRMTLDEGRTVFWSRSRQEVWRKGDTVGRAPVGEGATTTATATCCCSSSTRTAPAPATPASTPASTGASGADGDPAEPRRVPRAGRRHTVVPVWARCSPTWRRRSRVRQARRRRHRVPARVGGARRALEPLLVRRPRPVGHARAARTAVEVDGLAADGVPRDQGILAALEDAARRYGARASRTCPPLHGG
jgi:hypothetical protein